VTRAVLGWAGLSLVCLGVYAATAGVGLGGATWIAVGNLPLFAGVALALAGRAGAGLALVLGATAASLLASATAAFAWLQGGDGEAGIAPGVAAGAAACTQFLLAGAAWRARAALDATARGDGLLLALGLVTPLLFLLLAGAVLRGVAESSASAHDRRAHERAAREIVESVVRCAQEHAERNPARGYPPAQDPLAPGDRGCMQAVAAAGRASHYRVAYLPGVADAAGRVSRFVVCARPEDVRRGGVRTIVSDESGRVASYVPRRPEDFETGRALPCADVWFLGENDLRRGIEHCLLRWAAEHPESGYPPSLREVGPLGDACVPPEIDARLGYAPAAPDARGVIRDFALDTRPADRP
jgi:hypothetical protein